MLAIVFDGSCGCARPSRTARQARLGAPAVLTAGICKTDMEIVRGYAAFNGVLGMSSWRWSISATTPPGSANVSWAKSMPLVASAISAVRRSAGIARSARFSGL